MASRVPRVIVGVDLSYAGLRALREGVRQARQRGAELYAVRVYAIPVSRTSTAGYPIWPATMTVTPEPGVTHEEAQRDAESVIVRAFDAALGGVPGDIPTKLISDCGHVAPVLVQLAYRDDDLLILGASRRRRRRVRRTVAAFCCARATCPVLVVPAPEMAHYAGSRRRRRRLVRDWLADVADQPATDRSTGHGLG